MESRVRSLRECNGCETIGYPAYRGYIEDCLVWAENPGFKELKRVDITLLPSLDALGQTDSLLITQFDNHSLPPR